MERIHIVLLIICAAQGFWTAHTINGCRLAVFDRVAILAIPVAALLQLMGHIQYGYTAYWQECFMTFCIIGAQHGIHSVMVRQQCEAAP